MSDCKPMPYILNVHTKHLPCDEQQGHILSLDEKRCTKKKREWNIKKKLLHVKEKSLEEREKKSFSRICFAYCYKYEEVLFFCCRKLGQDRRKENVKRGCTYTYTQIGSVTHKNIVCIEISKVPTG